jgi:ATP-dependent RNA helicase DBP3
LAKTIQADCRRLLTSVVNPFVTLAAHQTSMFSATWPPEVAKLAAEFLRDPLKITIGSEDLTANHDVHQIVEVCDPTGREPKLEQLLRKYHADRK